jgi:uncharacterized protein (DUF1697 family)
MPRQFVFLRAINVGGRTITMARLAAVFGELGFPGAETFIASGNVVVTGRAQGAALEARLTKGLAAALGYPVDSFVRDEAELTRLAGATPYSPSDEAKAHALYVGLLHAAPPVAKVKALLPLCSATDDVAVQGREVWWLRRQQESSADLTNGRFEKVLGMSATFRNVTTLRRLAAKYGLVKA